MRAGASLDTVFVEWSSRSEQAVRLERAADAGARIVVVADDVLRRAADSVSPQPVATIVAMAPTSLADVDLNGFTAVCSAVHDPGNAGTVVRSVAASGGRAVVFCAGSVDIYNPKAVRASAGAVFRVPLVCDVPARAVLEHLGHCGIPRIGTVVRDGRDHSAFDWTAPAAVVFGSESHGLAEDLASCLDEYLTIAMDPGSESLNLAMAATVICFEAARQRRSTPTRS